MTEKKRTTVTTIETREVWVIRRTPTGSHEKIVVINPLESTQPDAGVPPAAQPDGTPETSPETSREQKS